MLKYLLDTNICIYVIKQRPVAALATFNKHVGQIAMSAITLAELLHGAEKSQHVERNTAVVDDFVSRLEVLDYTATAALHYGDIRAHLERLGAPIGVNDLHIAAHARSAGLTLVTNNERAFVQVEGVRLQNWV